MQSNAEGRPLMQSASSPSYAEVPAVAPVRSRRCGAGSSWSGHVAALLANVIWGSGAVVMRYGLNTMHPVVFAVYREILVCVLLGSAALFVEKAMPPIREAWRFIGIGLCIFITNLGFVTGVLWAGDITSQIMQPIVPILTTFLAIVLRFEKVEACKLVGIALAVAGCLCLLLIGASLNLESAHFKGVAALCCAVSSNAVYILLQKTLLARFPKPITVTAVSYGVAALAMGTTGLFWPGVGPNHDADWSVTWTLAGVWPLVFWVIFGSCIAYTCVTYANGMIAGSTLTMYMAVQPLVGTLLAVVTQTATLRWADLSVVLIIIGLTCVNWNELKATRRGGAEAAERLEEPEHEKEKAAAEV